MSGPEIRIVGGTLVDGTGAPGRPGTVEVREGRLRLTHQPGTEPAGRTIDATGKVVAPGFIDLHSPLGADDPRRAAPRAQGPPGHHDRGHRGRRQQLCAVRDPGGPRRVRPPQFGTGWRPRSNAQDEDRLVDGRELPGPVRRDRQPQHRLPDRQLAAPDPGRRLGGRPGDAEPARPDAQRSSARAWRRAPSVCHRASTTRRGATPHRRAGGAHRRGRQERRLLPHPRPLLAGRPLPRSVPRGDRDRPARPRRRPISPTSTTARRSPAAPTGCSTSSTTPASRGPGRHVRRLPARVGEHASPHPDPDLGPGRRPDQDEGAPRRPGRPRPDPATSSRTAARSSPARAGCATSASATSTGRSCCAWEGKTLGELIDRHGQRPGRHALRPAPGRGPQPQRGHARARTSTASAAS